MHPWDDLEQRFMRFTTAIVELAKSISCVVDGVGVPPAVVDRVSNLSNGMAEYVDQVGSEICDAMESKIEFDYKNRTPQASSTYQQVVFFSAVGKDGVVEIPTPILEELGWSVGDSLQFSVSNDNKSIIIRKVL